ncbi:hypothetical protein [Oscillatoria nigro-viridis]|uniref:hypothetical protein n=1 Tax=Phormidium nigroviride TaxID=482564 RepID=UPI00031AA72A|nr:hypothetical protein [Oscillatoria nigro-viridis]
MPDSDNLCTKPAGVAGANIKCECDRPGPTGKVRSRPPSIAHQQSQVTRHLRVPRTQSHYTIAEKSHFNVSIVLTHPHHFVLRTTTCDNIDTAIYIWRVIDVR